MRAVNGLTHNGANGNGTQEAKALREWKHTNVLFCHSLFNEYRVPYRAFRLLYHLSRRLGKDGDRTGFGIDNMAKVCRMKTNTVVKWIRLLEENKYISVERNGGKQANAYKILIPRNWLYVDHRLDDWELLPTEFRVLAYVSSVTYAETGMFFVGKDRCAEMSKICGMDKETACTALDSLEFTHKFVSQYEDRENPPYVMELQWVIDRPPEKAGVELGRGGVKSFCQKMDNARPENG